ncbi:glycosyltransferase family 4 protein [Pectinatus frisingensis]|uniref:glycosyltransferase family 4 protein n=1 Tax=Pectinatus frisingensis TaxID=865 RepID=UPI0018C74B2E|nr:glycosyltransferase family 4 protein [Pectinatus frisingensis]
MKILHINTNDRFGGAARAAYRIHEGLLANDVCSKLWTQNKTFDDDNIIYNNSKLDKIKTIINKKTDSFFKYINKTTVKTPWSLGEALFDSNLGKIQDKYDIVHLHWINEGFIPIRNMSKLYKPVVWTLHDSWAFTGGCHIPYTCKKYEIGCSECPQLSGSRFLDLSKHVFNKKGKYYKNAMKIVCPSKWLAECAKKSLLFKDMDIRVIPNGINIQKYQIRNKIFARQLFGVSRENKVILFGAMGATSDENKGFKYLYNAIRYLYNENKGKIEVVIFGSTKPISAPDFGFKTKYVGQIYDDITLNLLYSAADVMVVPSKSESFGQTAVEAMSSGTPCVAFNCTGLKDIIDNKLNGYLATPYDEKDLANGIRYIISEENRWEKLSREARKKVEQYFDVNIVSKKYISLYNEMLSENNNG